MGKRPKTYCWSELARSESSHYTMEEQVTIEKDGDTVRNHYAGRPNGAPFKKMAGKVLRSIDKDLKAGLTYAEIAAKYDIPASVVAEYDLHG